MLLVPLATQLTVGVRQLGQRAGRSGVRRQVGYLPEDHRFPDYHTGFSLLDFYGGLLGVPRRERLPSIPAMLELVGLPHKMDMKPLDLSAGEQQRIAIARALVNRPAIVLADEPTGNLDSVNSTMILDLFQDLNQRLGQTIMMITHNPDAAAVAHRTIEMKDGRVMSHGRVPQLVTGAGT